MSSLGPEGVGDSTALDRIRAFLIVSNDDFGTRPSNAISSASPTSSQVIREILSESLSFNAQLASVAKRRQEALSGLAAKHEQLTGGGTKVSSIIASEQNDGETCDIKEAKRSNEIATPLVLSSVVQLKYSEYLQTFFKIKFLKISSALNILVRAGVEETSDACENLLISFQCMSYEKGRVKLSGHLKITAAIETAIANKLKKFGEEFTAEWDDLLYCHDTKLDARGNDEVQFFCSAGKWMSTIVNMNVILFLVQKNDWLLKKDNIEKTFIKWLHDALLPKLWLRLERSLSSAPTRVSQPMQWSRSYFISFSRHMFRLMDIIGANVDRCMRSVSWKDENLDLKEASYGYVYENIAKFMRLHVAALLDRCTSALISSTINGNVNNFDTHIDVKALTSITFSSIDPDALDPMEIVESVLELDNEVSAARGAAVAALWACEGVNSHDIEQEMRDRLEQFSILPVVFAFSSVQAYWVDSDRDFVLLRLAEVCLSGAARSISLTATYCTSLSGSLVFNWNNNNETAWGNYSKYKESVFCGYHSVYECISLLDIFLARYRVLRSPRQLALMFESVVGPIILACSGFLAYARRLTLRRPFTLSGLSTTQAGLNHTDYSVCCRFASDCLMFLADKFADVKFPDTSVRYWKEKCIELNNNDWLFAMDVEISESNAQNGPYSLGNIIQCAFSYDSFQLSDLKTNFSWESFEKCGMHRLGSAKESSKCGLVGIKDIIIFIINIYKNINYNEIG